MRVFSRCIEIRRGGSILREGEPAHVVAALVDGMALRRRTLDDGIRQITSVALPGDICDLASVFFERMDYDIVAATDCEVALARREDMVDLVERHPALTRALWRCTLVDEAIQREWTVNVGRRSPRRRIAHFLCETFARGEAIGITWKNALALPLTKEQLADIVGLPVVHVARIVDAFRAERLLEFETMILVVRDWDRLREVAGFSRRYLHGVRDAEPGPDGRNAIDELSKPYGSNLHYGFDAAGPA